MGKIPRKRIKITFFILALLTLILIIPQLASQLIPAHASLPVTGQTVSGIKVTFYSAFDNDPPNSDEIAYPNAVLPDGTTLKHSLAGGTGTFDDPISFATTQSNTTFPLGTIIYLAYLNKFFIMEDMCADCQPLETHIWMDSGNYQVNTTDPNDPLKQCESGTARDAQDAIIVTSPPTGVTTSSDPLFQVNTDGTTTCPFQSALPPTTGTVQPSASVTVQPSASVTAQPSVSVTAQPSVTITIPQVINASKYLVQPPVGSGVTATGGDVTHVTFYGYPDNDPADEDNVSGSAIPGRTHAGGTGTYNDPVTYAAAYDGQFANNFQQGERIYITEVKKYFIRDDGCQACGQDGHIDLFLGTAVASIKYGDQAIINCESSMPFDTVHVIINPPNNFITDTQTQLLDLCSARLPGPAPADPSP